MPSVEADMAQMTTAVHDIKTQVYKLSRQKPKGDIFMPKDLMPFLEQLYELDVKLTEEADSHPENKKAAKSAKAIQHQIDTVYAKIWSMLHDTTRVDPSARPVVGRLHELFVQLHDLSKRAYTEADVRVLQEQLVDIESGMKDGKFVNEDGEIVEGQAVIRSLLHYCFREAHNMLIKLESVDPAMQPTMDKVGAIRRALRRIHDNSDTIPNLDPLKHSLDEIDSERDATGSFRMQDEMGEWFLPAGQAMVSEMLDDCYGILYELQWLQEALDKDLFLKHQELMQIVSDLRNCDRTGVFTGQHIRELQQGLQTIDNERVDGKWMIQGRSDVPKGQAELTMLLEEGFEIAHKLIQIPASMTG
eukprot:Clim_evm12s18 gene=Clim_evmTU12s18